MRRENGILTIEAAISMTAFLFFLLFFMNFGKVYMAQNMIAYGTYEAVKAISLDHYVAEAEGSTQVGELVSSIQEMDTGDTDLDNGEIFLLENGSIDALARENFIRAIAASGDTGADRLLKAVGIENGVNDIHFTCKLTDKIIFIDAECRVKLMFPMLGVDSVEIMHHAGSRLWQYVEETPGGSSTKTKIGGSGTGYGGSSTEQGGSGAEHGGGGSSWDELGDE